MARVKYYDEASGTWKYADEKLQIAPVQSVNEKTGAVSLSAADVGAECTGAVAAHDGDAAAHPHILDMIFGLDSRFMQKSDISIKKAQLTLEDGTSVLIDVVVASAGTTIQKYKNLVPTSIDTDGSIYNQVGYKEGARLTSSGAEKEQNNSVVTGYIPVRAGDVIRLGGAKWWGTGGSNYLCAYDSSFTYIGSVYGAAGNHYQTQIHSAIEYGEEVTTITLTNNSSIAYVRANWLNGTAIAGADVILTINEEIV